MIRIRSLSGALALVVVVAACGETPPTGPAVGPQFAVDAASMEGGALVSNSGVGMDNISCFFGTFTTDQGTALRSPSGNAVLNCHFQGLDPIADQEIQVGWLCTIEMDGISQTRQSQWVRSRDGTASLMCQFSGKPLYNATVSYDGVTESAQEPGWTAPLSDLPSGRVTAEVVHVGQACFFGPLPADPAGKIALIERGTCLFSDKLQSVEAAGAIAAIVYNSAAGGEGILTMGAPAGVTVGIQGVFVARSTGLALQALGSPTVTVAACGRSAGCRGAF